MYIRKKITGSNQLSNKILLFQVKTQLLKVINYYCLPDFCPGRQKIFFYFLNIIAGASTSKNSVASTSESSSTTDHGTQALPGDSCQDLG